MGESPTRHKSDVVNEVLVLILPRRTCTNIFIKSVHPSKRKIVPYYSQPLQTLMVQKAGIASKNYKSNTHQESTERLAQFMMPTRCSHRNITAARRVVLKAMCQTPVLISIQLAGLIEMILYERVVRVHAFVGAKDVLDMKLGPHFILLLQIIVRLSSTYLSTRELVKTPASQKR